MPLHVYTSQLAHHQRKGYFGKDGLNISRGSGEGLGLVFAPSRELVNEGQRRKKAAGKDPVKRAEAWAWYWPRYVEEMRASYRRNPGAWRELLGRERVTLLCYCGGKGGDCHRFVAAELLVKCGAIYKGEIPIGESAKVKAQRPAMSWEEAEAKVPGGPEMEPAF